MDGTRAYIGITDFAQNSLGDIVFIEIPEVGTEITAGNPLGVIESLKSASAIHSPASGIVVEINEELVDYPERVNKSPYESWIVVAELSDSTELTSLMNAEEYREFCE